MVIIQTPVEGFTGTVAGVAFVNGKGETESPSALSYFERQGYTVDAEPDPPKDPADPPKQPETSGTVLDRPAGNASLEAWQAYAVQEGHDVTDLKQSDIRALFTE